MFTISLSTDLALNIIWFLCQYTVKQYLYLVRRVALFCYQLNVNTENDVYLYTNVPILTTLQSISCQEIWIDKNIFYQKIFWFCFRTEIVQYLLFNSVKTSTYLEMCRWWSKWVPTDFIVRLWSRISYLDISRIVSKPRSEQGWDSQFLCGYTLITSQLIIVHTLIK